MRHYVCVCAIIAILGLTSCASRSVSKTFDQYAEAPAEKSVQSRALTDPLRNKKQKATVIAYEETSTNLTKTLNVKGIAVNRIEDYLQKAGLELVSRAGNERQFLEEETKLYKFFTAGATQYTGPSNVDYLIMGILTSIDASGAYESPRTYQGGSTPAKCNYTATITGTLKVYRVLDGKIMQTINLRGGTSKREDTTTSTCTVNANILPVVRSAVENALIDKRTELQNLFSQKGFITDKRINKEDAKDVIFRVSLGKQEGLEKGSKLEVYTRFLNKESLTGEARAEERKVADGEVTDFVGDDYAWLTVSEPLEASKIQLGDHVKVLHKKSFLEQIGLGHLAK